MGHHTIAVDQAQDGARDKGAEDDLEPEHLRQHGEADEQEEGAPDPDLGARVLKPPQRGLKRIQPAYTGQRRPDGGHQQEEAAEKEQRGPDPGLAREEQGEQDHGGKVGDGGGGDDLLAQRRFELPNVGEHGNHDAKRRGREHDRHEERGFYQTGHP